MKRWVNALIGFGLVACAKPVPPPLAPPPQRLAAAPAAQADFAERAAFGDAPPPSNTAVWCRVASPARDWSKLAQLMSLGALLDPRDILAGKLGAQLTAAVDLDRPADLLAFSGDAEDVTAVAALGVAGVAAFAARAQADFELVHMGSGHWRVVPKQSELESGARCELWQAPEPVGARLVCSLDASSIARAAPFLMSATRARPMPANMHVEVPAATFAAALKKSERRSSTSTDSNEGTSERAGYDLGRDLMSQFSSAVSGLSWDVTLHDAFVDVTQELQLQKSDGLMPVLVSGRSTPHPTVPDAFWQLPPDADLAFYFEGADPEPLRQAWATLVPRFVAGYETEHVGTPALRTELEDTLRTTFFRGGASELAYGQDLQSAAETLAEGLSQLAPTKAHRPKIDPELQRVSQKLGGWFVLGLEDQAGTLLPALRHALAVGGKDWPRRKDAKPDTSSPSHEETKESPLESARALPPGAVHFVRHVGPNPHYVAPADGSKPAPPPSTQHFIAVAEGGELWLAYAHDETVVTNRLRALLAAQPDKGIGADRELRALAATPPSGLGYVTIAGFVGLSLSANSLADLHEGQQALSNLLFSPGKGTTHVPVWLTTEGGNGVPRRVMLTARLPAPVLVDLMNLALRSSPHSD